MSPQDRTVKTLLFEGIFNYNVAEYQTALETMNRPCPVKLARVRSAMEIRYQTP